MTLTNIRPLSPSKLQDTRRWLKEVAPTFFGPNGDNFRFDPVPIESHIVVRELMGK